MVNIYTGNQNDFYEEINFTDFMDNFHGSTHMAHRSKGQSAAAGKIYVYHIEPEGVTLIYEFKKANRGNLNTVDLEGKQTSTTGIENRIKAGEQTFLKKQSLSSLSSSTNP